MKAIRQKELAENQLQGQRLSKTKDAHNKFGMLKFKGHNAKDF